MENRRDNMGRDFTDREKMDLFCIAWHLTNYWEDDKMNLRANHARACNTCKYNEKCSNDPNMSFYEHFKTLGELTGVRLSAAIGDREYTVRRALLERLSNGTIKSEEPVQKSGRFAYHSH